MNKLAINIIEETGKNMLYEDTFSTNTNGDKAGRQASISLEIPPKFYYKKYTDLEFFLQNSF